MTAYFQRLDATRFRATSMTEGAWDPQQMHVSPGIGLLAHAIECDRDARRDDALVLTRLSVDILGAFPVGDIEVQVRVLRPGRTIELVEASLVHDGRTGLLARAWLQQQYDTAAIAGDDTPRLPAPDDVIAFDAALGWAGGFAESIEGRREEPQPGHGRFWLRLGGPLVADEEASTTAHALGVADVVNGMSPRVGPEVAAYPNIDLTAHLYRAPVSEWLGCETEVSYGETGVGLTRATLHDVDGPIGCTAQTLTVRMQQPH